MRIRKTKKSRLVWIPISFFLISTLICLYASLDKTTQLFGYPLDDTYIHMAIAKNFVKFGNWGVIKDQFTSSTSSPLWTFLVSLCYLVIGVNDWIPLVLNLIFGILVVALCQQLLDRYLPSAFAILFTFAAIILTPLPILTLLGMEHNLHILVTIGFAFKAAQFIDRESYPEGKIWPLLVLAPILTMVRYEGFFIVAIVAAIFVFKRQILEGLALIVLSGVFHVIYGVISLQQNWYFLPNTILIKGNIPETSLLGILKHFGYIFLLTITTPHIVAIVVICLIVLFWYSAKTNKFDEKKALLIITLVSIISHLLFADVGWNYRNVAWFYRYESYFIYLVIFTIGIVVSPAVNLYQKKYRNVSSLQNSVVLIAMILVVIFPILQRSYLAFKEYPTAKKNIYEQQHQIAQFLHTFYQGKKVALNDIGWVSYIGDVEILDVMGLGSMKIGRLWVNQQFTLDLLIDIVNHSDVDVVILYDHFLDNRVPENWEIAGEWQIINNVVSGSDTIVFYALSSSQEQELSSYLKIFSGDLPTDVIQRGEYLIP